jgi:hypothetical protein
MHAAEHDHVRARLGRLLREAERIAHEIRHVLDFRHLIIVREDDGVELFLERENFLRQRLELVFGHRRARLHLWLNSRVIRNIIFDWSGTLVDDLPAVLKASNFVLTQAGKPEMSLDNSARNFPCRSRNFTTATRRTCRCRSLEELVSRELQAGAGLRCELPHAREFLEFCRAKKSSARFC